MNEQRKIYFPTAIKNESAAELLKTCFFIVSSFKTRTFVSFNSPLTFSRTLNLFNLSNVHNLKFKSISRKTDIRSRINH
jgi:hypothetical protein